MLYPVVVPLASSTHLFCLGMAWWHHYTCATFLPTCVIAQVQQHQWTGLTLSSIFCGTEVGMFHHGIGPFCFETLAEQDIIAEALAQHRP